jgi:hypothetical protein
MPKNGYNRLSLHGVKLQHLVLFGSGTNVSIRILINKKTTKITFDG